MQDRIASELHRSDITSRIRIAIQSAIKHYERERWYFNEAVTSSSLTTVASQAFYALPADFMKLDSITLTQSGWKRGLEPMSYIEMDHRDAGNSAAIGIPSFYSIYKNQLRHYPIPDSAYVVTLSYQKRLTTLSATTDTNEWVDDLEELIRCKAEEILCRYDLKDVQKADGLLAYINGIVYPTARAENDERLMSGKLTSNP